MRKSGDFEFTEKMNEISGYGGCHERACRAGVRAGARWFSEHPGAKPEFAWLQRTPIRALTIDAQWLLTAIEEADFVRDDGVHVRLGEQLTEEMMVFILFHALYIASHGWNSYVAKMTAPVESFEDVES
jgi:hypothetical protein